MSKPRHLFATLATALLSIGAAQATPAETSTGGTVVRLTPEQVEAAKEAAAERNMNAGSGIDNGVVSDRRIHGEAGFAIGTGGYRSVFGTAVMPLGQDGALALSFENAEGDFGRYGYGYRRR